MLSPPQRRSCRARRVDLDPARPARIGVEIGVECHAERRREHPVPVGDVPVVGDGAVALEERGVKAAKGFEEFTPRGGRLVLGLAHRWMPFVIRVAVRSTHSSSSVGRG